MEVKFRLQALESIEEIDKYNQGEGGEVFATEGTILRARLGPTFATYCPGMIFGHFLPKNPA